MAKKVETGVGRIIAVLLGVFGACWLFANSWRSVLDYIVGYKITENFINYFFGKGFFPIAALFTALLFIIASLKDLDVIVKGFSLVTAIVCAVVFLLYVIHFPVAIKSISDLLSYDFFMDVGMITLLPAYFLFAMYCRNGGSIRNVAWILAIISSVVVLAAAIFGLIRSNINFGGFLSHIGVILANLAMLYCGLKQY